MADNNNNNNESKKKTASIVPTSTAKSANLFSRLVNKAVQRVTESIDDGRKVGQDIVNNNNLLNSNINICIH